MNDEETRLAEIKEKVLAFARERDWEHFLWQSPEQSREDMEGEALRAKVEEELADIFIFAIEFANMTGIDVADAIERKMKRNAEKYPVEKARGKSSKYTEL